MNLVLFFRPAFFLLFNTRYLFYTAKTKTENSKQIFPEKELCGLSPNLHIDVSESDLYFPTFCLPLLLQGDAVCGPILAIYKIAHKHMNVEIRTEAEQFIFWEHINENFIAVYTQIPDLTVLSKHHRWLSLMISFLFLSLWFKLSC